MVWSPHFRVWCLHYALIAMSIQGMTPDPRDVTSSSITRILRSILGDGSPAAAGEVPLGDDTTDEKPNEVCTPASAAIRLAARVVADGPSPPHPILVTARASNRAFQSRSLLARPPAGGSARCAGSRADRAPPGDNARADGTRGPEFPPAAHRRRPRHPSPAAIPTVIRRVFPPEAESVRLD